MQALIDEATWQYRMSAVDVVQRPFVKNEIELLEHQDDEVTRLANEYRAAINNAMDDMKEKTLTQQSTFWKDFYPKKRSEMDQKVKVLLLPHQWKRLVQIVLQDRMKSGGVRYLIMSDDISEEVKQLAIPPDELDRINQIGNEANETLQKELSELRRNYMEAVRNAQLKAKQTIQSALTEEQRQKLEALLGPPLDQSITPEGLHPF
jgi:RNase P subunit RPR2